jgi:hypothetical protein
VLVRTACQASSAPATIPRAVPHAPTASSPLSEPPGARIAKSANSTQPVGPLASTVLLASTRPGLVTPTVSTVHRASTRMRQPTTTARFARLEPGPPVVWDVHHVLPSQHLTRLRSRRRPRQYHLLHTPHHSLRLRASLAVTCPPFLATSAFSAASAGTLLDTMLHLALCVIQVHMLELALLAAICAKWANSTFPPVAPATTARMADMPSLSAIPCATTARLESTKAAKTTRLA